MKTRYKKAKRILTFYYNHIGLKPPYVVLVCGTFCKQALTDKINIAEQLPKYLSGEIQLYTTKCAIKECELGGSLLYGPYKVLSQYDIIDCPHSWFKGSTKCLQKIVLKEKGKIILATQDEELASSVREHSVPLLHISHNSINLEPPSNTTKDHAMDKTSQKLTLSKKQEVTIAKMKQEMGLPDNVEKKKKRKKKGVNPLSCKKKKNKDASVLNGVANGGIAKVSKKSRKKKKKVKVPLHVKEALLKS
ncbi:rRNA-processing protein utp23 homolog [Plakobranchus ocellatus]|uniref:rRNA-processing protein utp23 homolog n=1 Tax=Plakobranchus ocellatus TaxID=259542 RepID=A0AAV4BJ40_9GAST|nr:rRNA-processing protein utp23 homolog [Plakobranchus ocellatus]